MSQFFMTPGRVVEDQGGSRKVWTSWLNINSIKIVMDSWLCPFVPEAFLILDQPQATPHSPTLTWSHKTRLMCCVLGFGASYELRMCSYQQWHWQVMTGNFEMICEEWWDQSKLLILHPVSKGAHRLRELYKTSSFVWLSTFLGVPYTLRKDRYEHI